MSTAPALADRSGGTVGQHPDAEAATGPGLPPAQPPRGTPRVGHLGLVLSVAVLALGLAGVHDGLVAAGVLSGTPWLEPAASASLVLRPGVPALLVAAVALGLGVGALLLALRPGRRRGVRLRGQSGAWLRHRDVARLAESAAGDVDGVTDAEASGDGRRVRVHVRSTSADVRGEVEGAVSSRLSVLDPPPRVRVDVDVTGPGSAR